MPKASRPYPEEFRREAVQMLRAGRTPREWSEALGVSAQTLRDRRRQDEVDRHERDDGLTSDERDELRRLRRENARLEQERASAQTSRSLLRSRDRDPALAYRMISAEKATGFPVSVACRLLGVSRSAYYELNRPGFRGGLIA